MKVVLDSLPPEGRSVAAGLDDPWIFEAARGALDAKPRALAATLQVRRAADGDGRFQVAGSLSVEWRTSCARCVRSLVATLEGPVDLAYQRGKMPDAEDVELEAGDLDIGWIEGGSLDLSDVVSEQIALWLPDRLLCASDGTSRTDASDDGVCAVPEHDGGPDLRKKSAFSGLANWKPPH